MSRWPIRYKLYFGLSLFFLIVGVLSFSGFRGVYAYRQLARSISYRTEELPRAAQLNQCVNDLRLSLSRVRRSRDFPSDTWQAPVDAQMLREDFRGNLIAVREALRRYREKLADDRVTDPHIGDYRREWEAVFQIERSLERVEQLHSDQDWLLEEVRVTLLAEELEELHLLSSSLPTFMQQRMHDLVDEVRVQYRTWIVLTWITSILAASMMAACVFFFYRWIFKPLRVLIHQSRRIARGDFDHRIQLDTHDEVAELARAMNDMTGRFQQIRDELDRQVRERTKEVVRSEQLASVGFLAAGVAHEINNPLASIAWSAESLESRLYDVFRENDCLDEDAADPEVEVLRKYLRRIQDEAFRCKGITERLLDYSRMGDKQLHDTDLKDLVQGVIEMVRHLGKYRNKNIQFRCDHYVLAAVNGQEIKQVVLNLITNGLDSLEPEGTVSIELGKRKGWAELVVRDDGCGMNDEVREHLFEPFFTRRRDGQGTGLGLSITYRIVQDHGGAIEATSEGPGRGSEFRVKLPLAEDVARQAA